MNSPALKNNKPGNIIVRIISNIPGALMIVPLFLGATINTFFPAILNIGSFSTALFRDGTGSLLGLFFFCMGSQISVKQTPTTLIKGSAILLGKTIAGASIGLLIAFCVPGGMLLGLTPLAVIAGMTNSNATLFVALTKQFGNSSDRGAVSVISLSEGPFATLVILGTAGLADFPLEMLIGCLLPLLIGFAVGNFSETARQFLKSGEMLLIPFLGFAVGRGIDFSMLLTSGLQGIVLGVATALFSSIIAILVLQGVYMLTNRPHATRNLISAPAEASVAGNAIATPAAVALLDPHYQSVVSSATSQIATACMVTAFLVPFAVMLVSRWQASRGISPEAEENWVMTGQVSKLGVPYSGS